MFNGTCRWTEADIDAARPRHGPQRADLHAADAEIREETRLYRGQMSSQMKRGHSDSPLL